MKKLVFVLLLLFVIAFARTNAQSSYNDALTQIDTLLLSSGGTLSAALDLQGFVIFKIFVPSTFDGTEITLKSSVDGINYYEVYDSDNAVLKITVTAGRWYYLRPSDYYWVDRYIKIFSNATAVGNDVFKTAKQKYFKR